MEKLKHNDENRVLARLFAGLFTREQINRSAQFTVCTLSDPCDGCGLDSDGC